MPDQNSEEDVTRIHSAIANVCVYSYYTMPATTVYTLDIRNLHHLHTCMCPFNPM